MCNFSLLFNHIHQKTHFNESLLKIIFIDQMPNVLIGACHVSWTNNSSSQSNMGTRPPNPSKNMMDCKWVFRIKQNSNGIISCYKACLVGKGHWFWLMWRVRNLAKIMYAMIQLAKNRASGCEEILHWYQLLTIYPSSCVR